MSIFGSGGGGYYDISSSWADDRVTKREDRKREPVARVATVYECPGCGNVLAGPGRCPQCGNHRTVVKRIS